MFLVILGVSPIRIAKFITFKDLKSLYRIAPGDSVVFKIYRPMGIGKVEVKDFLSGNTVYVYETSEKRLSDFIVNRSNDTVFWEFSFLPQDNFWNSCLLGLGIKAKKMAKYYVEILRYPRDSSLINFRTTVVWKTIAETTWVEVVDTNWAVVYDTVTVYDTLFKDTLVLDEIYKTTTKIGSSMFGMRSGKSCSRRITIELPRDSVAWIGFRRVKVRKLDEVLLVIVSSKSDEVTEVISSASNLVGNSIIVSNVFLGGSLVALSQAMDLTRKSPADISLQMYNYYTKRWVNMGKNVDFKIRMSPLVNYSFIKGGRIYLYLDNCYSKITDKYIGIYAVALIQKRIVKYVRRKEVRARKIPKSFQRRKIPQVRYYKRPT